MDAKFKELMERLREIGHINSARKLMDWDQEVNVPKKGHRARAKSLGCLARIAHEMFINPRTKKLIYEAKASSTEEAVMLRETRLDYEDLEKLPPKFVEARDEAYSNAHVYWEEAREKSNFQIFAPHLKRNIELLREEAGFYKDAYDNPYDVLLDTYECGETTAKLIPFFKQLKDFLVPFVQKIQASPVKLDPNRLKGRFPIAKQIRFNKMLAKTIGFDFNCGRMDISAHPFSTSFHPSDARLTNRYKIDDLFNQGIWGTLHEAGHSMYEQGLPARHFGNPLGEAISFGIHEGQSRFWENTVGRSRAFWKYIYPILQRAFPEPFSQIPFNEFYQHINIVRPSLIRIEADEVTYNLHIIARVEMEYDFINGKLDVKDAPAAFNSQMKKYLDLTVPNDREGILQDSHWAWGMMGYFSSYSRGNTYGPQLYHTLKQDLPETETRWIQGHFQETKRWLREKIHVHGRWYEPDELIKEATGEKPTPRYLFQQLKQRYSEVYELD